jgi:hypothetical protein
LAAGTTEAKEDATGNPGATEGKFSGGKIETRYGYPVIEWKNPELL